MLRSLPGGVKPPQRERFTGRDRRAGLVHYRDAGDHRPAHADRRLGPGQRLRRHRRGRVVGHYGRRHPDALPPGCFRNPHRRRSRHYGRHADQGLRRVRPAPGGGPPAEPQDRQDLQPGGPGIAVRLADVALDQERLGAVREDTRGGGQDLDGAGLVATEHQPGPRGKDRVDALPPRACPRGSRPRRCGGGPACAGRGRTGRARFPGSSARASLKARGGAGDFPAGARGGPSPRSPGPCRRRCGNPDQAGSRAPRGCPGSA